MPLYAYLQSEPLAYLLIASLFGLLIGSFLNVVILRLPRIMQYDWQVQCNELLGKDSPVGSERLGLVWPRSHCPQCQTPIPAWLNIPVFSYLMLRGKCAACGQAISIRYPLVEIITAMLTVVVAWHFGPSTKMLLALVLTWSLLTLSVIDLDCQLLPDDITLPLMWAGIAIGLFSVFTDLQSSVIGAIAGYGSLWVVFQLFRLITGKEGMGYGDFKLLAALGAWLGWQALPMIIMMASLCAALVGITMILLRRLHRETPISFGPYLALAGWLTLLWGQQLSGWYLQLGTG